MAPRYDLIVRVGTVVDGTGAEPFAALSLANDCVQRTNPVPRFPWSPASRSGRAYRFEPLMLLSAAPAGSSSPGNGPPSAHASRALRQPPAVSSKRNDLQPPPGSATP